MIIYICTPPWATTGERQNDNGLFFHTTWEAQEYFRKQYPAEVKRANTAAPVVDWKRDWITTIDTDTDLA